MGQRDTQKHETRRRLFSAALRLAPDGGLASIGLRQLTREAGIAPSTFYRHFDNMDDLGRSMVDEMGLTLRNMVNEALRRIEADGSVISTCIDLFLGFLDDHPELFRLLVAERYGGSPAMRRSVETEIRRFMDDVEHNLRLRAKALQQPMAHYEAVAEAMVTLVFDIGVKTADMAPAERRRVREHLLQQLYLLSLGSVTLAAE